MLELRIKAPTPKELLKRAGLRHTKQREIILEILLQSPSSLTANELSAILKEKDPSQNYWLSTIYRTLDFLLHAKLLTRIDFPNADEAAYIAKSNRQDQHYAVCLSCHKILPLRRCPLEDSMRQLSLQGFSTSSHRVEIFGYCEQCRKKQRTKK